jgi:hypothetical protein
MTTSDQVIDDIVGSVARLGAPDDFVSLLRISLFALSKLSIAEHQFQMDAAEGMYRH